MCVRGRPRFLLAALFLLVPLYRHERPWLMYRGNRKRRRTDSPKSTGTSPSRAGRMPSTNSRPSWTRLATISCPSTPRTASPPGDSCTCGDRRRCLPTSCAAIAIASTRKAQRWLDRGTATRDEALFAKVVEDAFCSRPAERALRTARGPGLRARSFRGARSPGGNSWLQSLRTHCPSDSLIRSRNAIAPASGRNNSSRTASREKTPSRTRTSKLSKRNTAPPRASSAGGPASAWTSSLACSQRASVLTTARRIRTTYGGDAGRGRVQAAEPRLLERLSSLCRAGPACRGQFTRLSGDFSRTVRRVSRKRFCNVPSFPAPCISSVDRRRPTASRGHGRVMSFDLRRAGDPGTELYPAALIRESVP